MDLITIILIFVLLIIPFIYLFPTIKENVRVIYYLEKMPGHIAYPLIGTAYSIIGLPMAKMFDHIIKECKLFYPKPFRTYLGKHFVVHLHKPEHFENIVNNQVHISKGTLYATLQPWLGLGLLTSTGKKWHSHRKMITPAFHFKILDIFQDIFFEKAQILLDKLESNADGKIFNIYPYITACALDIICETAMGVKVDAQNSNSEYVRAVFEISELITTRNNRPWYHIDFIWNNSKHGQRFNKCLSVLHGFTTKVIRERKLARKSNSENESVDEKNEFGEKKRLAFLDILLDASLGGVKLTDEEIREETDTFMFEGHDTTTAAICWNLFVLGNNPEVQAKVHQELDEIFQGSDRPIRKQDLLEMKYLEQAIKETLRLYPSVPLIGRTAEEDVTISGYLVPKGTMLVIHIFAAQRDPDHFPNPDVYNPDNFLPDRVAARHPYAFMPFSAGPRNCIGQKFAMLEEKAILSTILRKYTVKCIETPEKCQMTGFLILRNLNGCHVSLTPRT